MASLRLEGAIASDLLKAGVLLLVLRLVSGWAASVVVVAIYFIFIRAMVRSLLLARSLFQGPEEAPVPAPEPELGAPADRQAAALLRKGSYDDALELLDQGLEEDPTDARLYLLRGLALRHMADEGGSDELVRGAIRDLQAAMVLSRSISAIPHVDLVVGALFSRLKEAAKARRHFERVLARRDAPLHVLDAARSGIASLEGPATAGEV